MKTIEEAAREKISIINVDSANFDFISKNKKINGSLLLSLIELSKYIAELTQRWIPIEEELPKTNEFHESKKCLVKNTYENVDVARYYSNTKSWYFNSSDFVVTHWRPIELL